MKIRIGYSLLLAALASLLFFLKCQAPEDTDIDPKVLLQLKKTLVKLPPGSPLDYTNKSFKSLIISPQVDVIGLGEGAHGVREFFEIKQRLIQYLVEEKGFKAVAYEFNYSSSLDLNEYVLNGQGDLKELIANNYWIQKNQQFMELITWMRLRNQSLPYEDRVHFIGIDAQVDMLHIPEISRRMEKMDPVRYISCKNEWDSLLSLGKPNYRDMDPGEYQLVLHTIQALSRSIKETVDHPDDTTKLILHGIDAMEKSHHLLYCAYQTKERPRDRNLADNTLWIKQLLGNDVKIILWAHNAHIGRNPLYHEKDGGSMGLFLSKELGDRYLPIATTFCSGTFTAVTADSTGKDTPPHNNYLDGNPPAASVNYLLSAIEDKNYMLDLRTLDPAGALAVHLNQVRPFLDIGDFYTGHSADHYKREFDAFVNVYQSFDVLFFFRNTQGLHLLLNPGPIALLHLNQNDISDRLDSPAEFPE